MWCRRMKRGYSVGSRTGFGVHDVVGRNRVRVLPWGGGGGYKREKQGGVVPPP